MNKYTLEMATFGGYYSPNAICDLYISPCPRDPLLHSTGIAPLLRSTGTDPLLHFTGTDATREKVLLSGSVVAAVMVSVAIPTNPSEFDEAALPAVAAMISATMSLKSAAVASNSDSSVMASVMQWEMVVAAAQHIKIFPN